MSQSRLNKDQYILFQSDNDLYMWFQSVFNNPFHIHLTQSDNVYLSASDLQIRFSKLLKNNASNLVPFLRKRSSDNKNIWHLLFSYKINRDNLNASTETGIFSKEDYCFQQKKQHHIFLLPDLRSRFEKAYPHKEAYSQHEYKTIFTQCIAANVPFYFKTLEDYFSTQITNITKDIIAIFSKQPDLFKSMLLERDDNGLTPLHYLFTPNEISKINLHTLMREAITAFTNKDKEDILFAEDDNKRLFLHNVYTNLDLNPKILADAFGEENLARALVHSDIENITPFHLACEKQTGEILDQCHQLLASYNLQFVLFQQDANLRFPPINLVNNKKLTTQAISECFSHINIAPLLNQLLTLHTRSDDTLLTHAIVNNRETVIRTIKQHIDQSVLFAVLIHENKSHQYPLHIAYLAGNLETFQLVVDLYSPWRAAFCGILTAFPFHTKAKHFSESDKQHCLNEIIGTDSLAILKLIALVSNLINPQYSSDTNDINEFSAACVCIAQGYTPPVEKSTYTFFLKRTSDFSSKLQGISTQNIQWFFAEVLPFINIYTSNLKMKKCVETMLDAFNTKIQAALQITPPIRLIAPDLQPIYDGPLESRWRDCNIREQTIGGKEKKKHRLTLWEKNLDQCEREYFPEITKITTSFSRTIDSKTNIDSMPDPIVYDALEHRRLECANREKTLAELDQWETQLKKREDDLNAIQTKRFGR